MDALVVDPRRERVRVGIAASQQGFEVAFLEVLNARTRDHGN